LLVVFYLFINVINFRNICMDHHEPGHEVHEVFSLGATKQHQQNFVDVALLSA